MAWLALLLAIALEVTATLNLKATDGFTRLAPTSLVLALYAGSFWLLAIALRRIEVGVAYAIWAGVGTAAIALLGIVLFGESRELIKLGSIGLIVLGVIGLQLAGSHGG